RAHLLRPEAGEPPAHRHDRRDRGRRHRMRTRAGRPAQLLEPEPIPALPAALPDVERLPADPVPGAQLDHAPRPALVLPQQRDTLFHRTALPEGHRSNLLVIRASLTCQGCSRSILSVIYPVRTVHTPWRIF